MPYFRGEQLSLMAIIDILLPKMGESVAEATITKLVVDAGSEVEADDPIVEIATDKVDSEVPAPEDGTLVEWCVAEGDVVQVGAVIARYDVGGEGGDPATAPAAGCRSSTCACRTGCAVCGRGGRGDGAIGRRPCQKRPLWTFLLAAGAQHRRERRHLHGRARVHPWHRRRGPGHQERHLVIRQRARLRCPATPAPAPAAAGACACVAKAAPVATSVDGAYDIVEMDRMRKMIADHMVRSVQTSPHVTSFVEADVTNLVQWRNANKKAFQEKFGEKLTFTPLIAEAIVKAIRDFPGINASVDGDRILIHKNIHLGMAAALPSGNLIVPVIKHADQYNLQGLARQVNDLAARARAGKLTPDDIAGGTYTMSNVGTFGNVMGTPIINQPQVGILALGAIRKRPAVLETEQGDVIAVRSMMFLSHSYDHRVVDGMLGGSFVRRVADYLEGFDPNRPIEG